MNPYYQDDGITIYHGDCMEILPHMNSVDIVVTDPPYGMQFQSGRRIIHYSRIPGDNKYPIEAVQQLRAIARRAVYLFCRWDNLRELDERPKSVLAWVKNHWSMGDLQHEHGRQWEAIVFYPGPEHEFERRIPDVLFADRTGNELHPTEKPVSLMKQLIGANVGEYILDPFMGSGATLCAAKDLGRKAIGIEIEEKYCEVAARRLSQSVMPF